MNNEAQVRIRRNKSFSDRLRAYRVELDGVQVASLRNGDLTTFPVIAGSHTLSLKIDWCGSEDVHFDAVAGECVEFVCGSSLTGWRILLGLFYVCFRPRKYLFLQRLEKIPQF